MKKHFSILLLTALAATCLLTSACADNNTEPDITDAPVTTVSETTADETITEKVTAGNYMFQLLDMTVKDIIEKYDHMTYLYSEGDTTPIYYISALPGIELMFLCSDIEWGDLPPDSATPSKILIIRDDIEVYPGILLYFTPAQVEALVPEQSEGSFDVDSGLFNTGYIVDDYVVTLGWKLPDKVEDEVLAMMTSDDHGSVYNNYVEDLTTNPQGHVVEIYIRKK